MREIKFRAWDKIRENMIYLIDEDSESIPIDVYTLELWNGGFQIIFYNSEDDKTYYGEDQVILLQYTGLKDKNEKEIYEGDIVKQKHYSSDYKDREEVKWHRDNASFDPFNWGDYSFAPCYCEVIGNIYENPELLNESN